VVEELKALLNYFLTPEPTRIQNVTIDIELSKAVKTFN
jgi:hypothetical protein